MMRLLPFLLAVGCASGVKMSDQTIPTCTTVAECKGHDGKRVAVVGVYTLHESNPNRKLDDDSPKPVRLVLAGEKGPFLEPFWHKDAVRPKDEVAKYQGKTVRVTGTFHAQQPRDPSAPPHAAAMGGSCVHPVESITEE